MKETLILLPGWTGKKLLYQKFIDSAPTNFQVIVLQYSEIIPNGNIESFNQKLEEFLDKNNLSVINLVGHSLGGALAIKFTVDKPKRVKKLYLLNSEGVYGQENLLQVLWKILPRNKTNSFILLNNLTYFIQNLLTNIKLGIYAYRIDLQSEMKKVKIPTMIIWGIKDQVTPLWQGKKIHQLIQNSELVVLKEMDHNWIIHSPEKFWENI